MIQNRKLAAILLAMLPFTAFAAAPEIDEAAWSVIPKADQQAFEHRESDLAVREREAAAARAALGTDDAVTDGALAEKNAEIAVGSAKDDVSLAKAQGKSDVKVARLEYDEADHAYDGSKQAVDEAGQEKKLARTRGDKTDIADAKGQVSATKKDAVRAKQDRTDAEAGIEQAKVDAQGDIAASKAGVDAAAAAEETASLEADRAKADRELARLRVDVLDAQGRLGVAELELDKARAANEAGATVDLAPFEAASAEAHDELSRAEGHVAEHDAS